MTSLHDETHGIDRESPLHVGDAIRWAREGVGITIRELGRRSAVSAAQISRIESGAVKQPSIDTLISIARVLYRNPKPLLIVSGHVAGPEARDLLKEMLGEGTELAEDWGQGWERELAHARELVEKPDADDEAIRRLAVRVFVTADTEETLFWDSWLGPLLEKSGGQELRELVYAWELLTAQRKQKVLEYVLDQSELSSRERYADPTGASDSTKEEK